MKNVNLKKKRKWQNEIPPNKDTLNQSIQVKPNEDILP